MRSPAPRYPTLGNVQDGRSPGFSDRELRELEEGERLSLTEADKPGVGPLACLAGEAAARTAAQGVVPGTVPDRPWPRPLRIEA